MAFWWLGGALVALLLLALWAFNSMVGLRTRGQAAWSDIDTQLKKRYDLIPQLVAVAEGYMHHEKKTFTRIAELRSQAMAAKDLPDRAQYEQDISSELNSILVLVEDYPELKAAPQFLSLQHSLTEVEDHISRARRYYNAVVRDYDSLIASFPIGIIAALCGFKSLAFFAIEDTERQAPSAAIS